MDDATYISVTGTAKEIRKAIKAAFPGVVFTVKSTKYSGGASVNVSWTDGPTAKEVDVIVSVFAGATFDSMEDLKSYHKSKYNGQIVRWGADYVFTNRNFSREFMQRRADDVATRYGFPVPTVIVTSYGGIDIKDDYSSMVNGDTLVYAIIQKAHRTRAVA